MASKNIRNMYENMREIADHLIENILPGMKCSEIFQMAVDKYDHSEVSENYVMGLEMHMYRKNVGVVKVEDMILITNSGNEILTKSPRHLFEL